MADSSKSNGTARRNGRGLPRDAFVQRSRSGTVTYGGISRPDDYLVEMVDPVRRCQTYEEMRASDDGVQSAIDTREKLILASNWKLTAPDDSDLSRQITEFCEDNIYPKLDDLLRWLGGGGLQYGFGVIEPVYAYADNPLVSSVLRGGTSFSTRKYGRRIYLVKLAHIRQRTIHTFLLNDTGDLQALRQYAWNGSSFKVVDIPAEKLLLWTYNRQGDDYWGVPPTRNVYKAWTFKNQLERLNILGIDRFGTGTPVAEAGPGWQDADFERMDTYLENWRAGESTYLVHPAGGKITIVSAAGQMTMATLDWVKYYNLAITKAFYTQGSELGSTETGARAVGEVMLEQTETVVQADNEALASLINEKLVKPLVIMNFGEQDAYPRFEPSQRVRSSSELPTMLTTMISAKGLTWRPEDESWFRDVMKMPSVSVDELVKLAAERQQKALEIAKAAGLATKSAGSADGENAPGDSTPPEQIKMTRESDSRQLARLRPTAPPEPALLGETWRTHEFSDFEMKVVKPGVVARDLDLEVERTSAEVKAALVGIDNSLADQVRVFALDGADKLAAAVRRVAVPAGARAKLRQVLETAADRARSYGTKTVISEMIRQIAIADPNSVEPQTRTDAWASWAGWNYTRSDGSTEETAQSKKLDAAVRAEIDRAVEEEVSRREASARSAAIFAIHSAGNLTAAQLADAAYNAAKSQLEDLSPARTSDNISGVVNIGFGAGRNDGAEMIVARNPDGIVAQVYSAVMDRGTCDECGKWDGATFPYPVETGAGTVQAPNPRCEGTTKRCRCIWISITTSEIPSAVPASKGVIAPAGFPY